MSSKTISSTAPPDAASRLTRFAVFERRGDTRAALGIVLIDTNAEGELVLSGSTERDENVAKFRGVLEKYKSDGGDHASALAELFRREGYEIEPLPAGDYQINLQIDQMSGDVLGTQEAMHALVAADNPVARNIREAMAKHLREAGDELAEQIVGCLATGDSAAAIATVKNGQQTGVFAFPPSVKLLDALMAIDVVNTAPEDRRLLRELRMAVAHRLNRFDLAGAEGEALLAEFEAALTKDQITDLRMLFGLAAITKGNKETALLMWREVLREPNLTAEQRAWAQRNISMTLGIRDPEGLRATKLSADAFLEAGNKEEAGKSLMALANGQLFTEPTDAINTISDILALFDREGLRSRHLRAAALHIRAHRLMDLGRHQEAFEDVREAANLRRGILGLEPELVSSLHLAALEASRIGADDAARELETEAESVTNALNLVHFQLVKRLAGLGTAFDTEAAADLIREAEAAGATAVAAGARIIEAMADPILSDADRMNILEDMLRALDLSRGRNVIEQPVRLVIASRLVAMNHPERAELYYRQLLNDYPLDVDARDGLLHCLFELERWRDAAQVLEREIAFRGEMPGLLFSYGKALFEAGDVSAALPVLTKAADRAADNEVLRRNALELREKAFHLGATMAPIVKRRDSAEPVSLEEFEAALDAFAKFIKQDKRMRFWRTLDEAPGHRWIDHPEGRAQDLLHGWMKAVFGDRVQAFAEIAVGAGRIDLLVQFIGGLKIVVELKMCGYGYSSTYAAAGEDQILHYLDNSDTHLGYLIVLDARLDKNGEPLFETPAGPYTVVVYLIDVRPRTTSKRKADRPNSDGGEED